MLKSNVFLLCFAVVAISVISAKHCGSPETDGDGCNPAIICPAVFQPVCGSDGKTYGNTCELSRCPGVTLVHEGNCCNPAIICPAVFQPVCGSDGKTYGNTCELSRCPGVTLVHEGDCEGLYKPEA